MIELPCRSVPELIKKNAVKFADLTALSYKKEGQWVALSYANFYERILMTARGLRKVGVCAGDRVALFSENRAGWVIADLGIQAIRAISVPIYATNTPEQAAYVLNHAGCKVVFVSSHLQYGKLLKIRDQIPGVETVIAFERFLGEKILPVLSLYQLSEESHPITVAERTEIESEIDRINSEDLVTVIYTSGTTGVPKGVMLSHRNVVFDAWYGLKMLGGLNPGEVFLSFLPLSHILERTAGYYAPLMSGCTMAFAESVEKVVENIVEVRPTAMVSVPRLFEKIIVDRKKELIVTAGGKNIAPQPLENELKLDKFISQVFVFGDRKAYLVALVTANIERLIEFAQQQKIDYIDLEDLASNEKVHKLFAERIGLVNEKLPPYETIKKFVVLARDFSVEGGELTPTLKLRRKVIYEKYKDKIERLYLEDSQTPTGQK